MKLYLLPLCIIWINSVSPARTKQILLWSLPCMVWFLLWNLWCFLMQLGPKAEDVQKPVNPFVFALRFILGAIAATYFVLVPIYMWLKDQIVPKGQPIWNIEIFWVASADNKADSCAFLFLLLNILLFGASQMTHLTRSAGWLLWWNMSNVKCLDLWL